MLYLESMWLVLALEPTQKSCVRATYRALLTYITNLFYILF